MSAAPAMLLIRPATLADAPGIRQVHLAAFPTTMEADLVERLEAAGHADISLVAEAGGLVVGHVLFSPVTLQANCAATGGVGLAPVAVLPEHQRQRIGSWLVLEGIAVCRRRGHRFVVVLGEPDWYRRFGFEPARIYGLASEYDAGDAFMALPLSPGALPPEGGLVRYAPAFATLDSPPSD